MRNTNSKSVHQEKEKPHVPDWLTLRVNLGSPYDADNPVVIGISHAELEILADALQRLAKSKSTARQEGS